MTKTIDNTPHPALGGILHRWRRGWSTLRTAGVVVAVVVCGVVAQLSADYHTALDNAAAQTSALANAIDQHISGSIRSVDTLLTEVAAAVEANQHTDAAFSQKLLSRLPAFPEIRYVGVVTADGLLLPGTWPNIHGPANGLDVRDRRYFQRQRDATGPSRLVIGQAVVGRISGERSLHVSRPLRDKTGKFAGVVIASLNPDIYAEFLNRATTGHLRSAGVFSLDGQLLARTPDHARTFGLDASDNDLFRVSIPQAPVGINSVVGKADGVDKIQAYRVLDGYPMVVTTGMPRREALQDWYRLAIVEGFLLMAVSGMMLFWARQADSQHQSLLRHQAMLEDTVARRTAGLQIAHDNLSRAKAQLQLILDSAAEGIYGIDNDNRVMFVNQAALDLLGWHSSDTLAGRRGEEVLNHSLSNGQSCRHGQCAIRQTLVDGVVRRVSDEYFRGPNMAQLPVEYVVAPNVINGVIQGAVVVFRDITDIKTTLSTLEERQTRLQQMARELERSNQELEHFAYVASHDLREPLRMISMYLALLDRRLKDRLDADETTFIGFAVDGAKRMDLMINDLLDYSRISRTEQAMEPVDLEQSLHRVQHTLSQAILDRQGQIHVAFPLPTIMGYPAQIDRLLQNLIGNSLKFHQPDLPPQIWISAQETDQAVIITVRDNGMGIAPQDHERVFEIFQRLGARSQYEGTGIGLAACRKIAEHHGGSIGVQSQEGQGAVFTLTLPASPAQRGGQT